MKITLSHVAAPVAMVLAAPIFATAAFAGEPVGASSEDSKKPETEATSHAPAAKEVKEEKRICRRVKLDMSSRRATKVCKTSEEWREFNQRR